MKRISLPEVRFIAFQLAQELMLWDEPFPDFSTRFPQKLESCLETPFQTFRRKSLYRGLIEKSSILFYLLTKNHPFQNGNKRIAVTTLLVFLHKNKKWLTVSPNDLYTFAVFVAKSDAKEKDLILKFIQTFLKKNLKDI
jgi:death-on-curing family protein